MEWRNPFRSSLRSNTPRAESALLRGERENFFVVISNAKAFGETLADLSAAASELATHSDDEG